MQNILWATRHFQKSSHTFFFINPKKFGVWKTSSIKNLDNFILEFNLEIRNLQKLEYQKISYSKECQYLENLTVKTENLN